MEKSIIPVKKTDPRAIFPTYGSDLAAGADLYALTEGDVVINPGETVLLGTGISMEIPPGFAGFTYARSGLASKRGLAPANKVGVIDSDYRGEIMIPLHNHSSAPETISCGDRIAQIVIAPVLRGQFKELDSLGETGRGDGGFGSTGSR